MPALELLHVFGSDFPEERGWDLVAWCLTSGANEFTVGAIVSDGQPQTALEPFDQAAAPYRLPEQARRHLSGPPSGDLVFPTPLWALTPATLSALRLAFPRGPFDYYPVGDAWFEDLEVYAGGELMLGIITHEHEGVLRVTSHQRAQLDIQGFPYRMTGEWVGY